MTSADLDVTVNEVQERSLRLRRAVCVCQLCPCRGLVVVLEIESERPSSEAVLTSVDRTAAVKFGSTTDLNCAEI